MKNSFSKAAADNHGNQLNKQHPAFHRGRGASAAEAEKAAAAQAAAARSPDPEPSGTSAATSPATKSVGKAG